MATQITNADITAAEERMREAAKAYHAAREASLNAGAEAARLHFIALAHDTDEGSIPVAGFRFTTEYCYDDEGGYFDSINVMLVDSNGDDIDYDDSCIEPFGPEVIRRLCGCSEDADQGEITVAEAREKSF